jgi:hypothetical protein
MLAIPTVILYVPSSVMVIIRANQELVFLFWLHLICLYVHTRVGYRPVELALRLPKPIKFMVLGRNY